MIIPINLENQVKVNENENKNSNFTSYTTNDSHQNLERELIGLNNENIYNEGFLIKITNLNKQKKLFFKLIGKDFYCKNIYFYF